MKKHWHLCFTAMERFVYTNMHLHLHFKHRGSIYGLFHSFHVCGMLCEYSEFSVSVGLLSALVQIHFLDSNKNLFASRVWNCLCLMSILCVLSDCSTKLTKKFICFPPAEAENTIWCPRCHLRNSWRIRLSERQALWSRRKSLVTNLQCLPDRRVAYNKKASSSELNKTNGKDRCHSHGSKQLQEMNQLLIWDLFISNTENSHHCSSSLVK